MLVFDRDDKDDIDVRTVNLFKTMYLPKIYLNQTS